ncbi:YqjF family protein [Pseudonocardia acidicola]|uniref:DUF2071 domain-containing protein n=1 Tax=Pseudonocardia acidicola TaxID=2724939 RepID=A0ABX1S9C5_9PSEU|nr:DUF2071 domain-containing protein [Pseudonocardia acidicola]NMH98169.1 DUF2071 domain-containing protein [Pseudonocardia acidicola]
MTITGPVPEPVSTVAPRLRRPRLMRQDWRDIAFLHWAVDPDAVAGFMPPGVYPDTLDGSTYVGLVPFRMVDAGFARGPAIPWAGTFLETNVRLYSVDGTGRRGIVFLSLDTDRAVVVAGARTVSGLPYRWARMHYRRRRTGATIEHTYTAALRRPGRRPRSRIVVRSGGPVAAAPLDEFLTARWGLHVAHLGRTWYIPNAHPAWPLRAARVTELDDDLLASVGFGDLAGRPPDLVAFSDGVRTEFGPPVLATTPRDR